MIYAGIDIAKYDHVISALDEGGTSLAGPLSFTNSTDGFASCVSYLVSFAEAKDVLVGVEATGHYWLACFTYLCERGFDVVVLNPMQTNAVRRLSGNSRVKNDRIDSRIIAQTLRFGNYTPSQLADPQIQKLRHLTRFDQELKESVADLKRQVICAQDQLFPEYESLFSNMFGETSKTFLSRCPSPEECLSLDTRTLIRLLGRASRGRFGKDKALQIRECAQSSCGLKFSAETLSFQIKLLIEQINFIEGQVREVDAKIKVLLDATEPLILTIPGISYTLGAQIVSEIGDIERFDSASALVRYAGLNPSVHQSGTFTSQNSSISKQGSSYLRRALWLAAEGARRFDPTLKAFYDKKRGEGKPHRVAVGAVSRKLTHIIYAVLRNQVVFDSTHQDH